MPMNPSEPSPCAPADTVVTGSLVALLTPFADDESLDCAALRQLVDWHVEQGSNGIVVVGTTGESPTVTEAEHCDIIRVAVEQAAGRVHVMAGCGSNSTREAIHYAEYAKSAGADSQLQVVPYYNKPSQQGLLQHFTAIADAVELPLILYNVPGRTAADLHPDTALQLAEHPNIAGIKEATGDIERAQYLIRHAPADFAVYSGDDGTAVALMLAGGKGNISVTANVAPRLMQQLCAAAIAGDAATAMRVQLQLLPLHQALFLEANPIPVKWAAAQLGLCNGLLRLPLTPLSPDCHAQLRQAMQQAGIQPTTDTAAAT